MRLCEVEVEMGVMRPRGKEHREAQGAGDQEGLSPRVSGESSALQDTWFSGLWLQDCETHFCWVEAPSL